MPLLLQNWHILISNVKNDICNYLLMNKGQLLFKPRDNLIILELEQDNLMLSICVSFVKFHFLVLSIVF